MPDPRPERQVVRYEDEIGKGAAVRAIDVLECGHRVTCGRKPGGRVVVQHVEPCDECERGGPA